MFIIDTKVLFPNIYQMEKKVFIYMEYRS